MHLHGVCRPRALYVNGRRSIAEALWFTVCLLGPLLRGRFDVIDCNEHPYFPLFACKIARLPGADGCSPPGTRSGETTGTSTWAAGAAGRLVEGLAPAMPDEVIAVSGGRLRT